MKRLLVLFTAILLASVSIAKQPIANNDANLLLNETEYDKFAFGFGLGFGFFYPSDVNDWLESEYSNYTVSGLDLYMSEQLSVVASFRPLEMIRFNIVAEACIGPKLVVTDDQGVKFHNFGRYSLGTEAYLNVPIGSGRHSMLFGAGVMVHNMHFEEARASTVGLRIIPFGMSFQFGNFQPQVLVGGDLFTKAKDENFELSYNQGFVHINILF